MKLLVSLHDVTPYHAPRLARAEALLAHLGIADVAYLIVPRFHGATAIDTDQAFLRWMRQPRPYRVTWFLHGCFHQDARGPRRAPGGPVDWLKRALLTDGEGEFLSLDAAGVGERLDLGLESFLAARGRRPTGFVAPAWLYNGHLRPALVDRGFALTEDHGRISLLARGIEVPSPVITWSARTPWRRRASCLLAPRLLRWWKAAPVLRIAIHPFDMECDDVVDSIRHVVTAARYARGVAAYADIVLGAYDVAQNGEASSSDSAISSHRFGPYTARMGTSRPSIRA
jgi:predicted deacetylase